MGGHHCVLILRVRPLRRLKLKGLQVYPTVPLFFGACLFDRLLSVLRNLLLAKFRLVLFNALLRMFDLLSGRFIFVQFTRFLSRLHFSSHSFGVQIVVTRALLLALANWRVLFDPTDN